MAYTLGGVEQAQAQARTAALRAGQTAASAISLPNILKDSLSKLFAKDNPLYQQREQALQGYYEAPEAAEAEISKIQQGGVLFTPTQQRQLIAQSRAAAVSPLTTVNDLIQLGIGGIGDLVTRAGTTFQGAATAAQARADALSTLAQQRMALYQQQVQEEQFRQSLAATYAGQGAGTQTERAEASAKSRLTADVKNLKTRFKGQYNIFPQLVGIYRDDLSYNQIKQIYDKYSPYGPAGESYEQVVKYLTGAKSTAGTGASQMLLGGARLDKSGKLVFD